MSHFMTKAVIEMPYEMAMSNPITQYQFYQRSNELLTEVETLRAELAHKDEMLKVARDALVIVIDCRPIGYETMTEAREHKIRKALAAIDVA